MGERPLGRALRHSRHYTEEREALARQYAWLPGVLPYLEAGLVFASGERMRQLERFDGHAVYKSQHRVEGRYEVQLTIKNPEGETIQLVGIHVKDYGDPLR